MSLLDINEIRRILPHRYPMLLVDRIIEMDEQRVVGIKNVTNTEPFFNGHFPHRPVMPGVLMLEALAQAAAILAIESMGITLDDQTLFYFAVIYCFRFKRSQPQ